MFVFIIYIYLSYMIDITKSSTPCALLKGIGSSCLNGELCDDTYGIAKCVYVFNSSLKLMCPDYR